MIPYWTKIAEQEVQLPLADLYPAFAVAAERLEELGYEVEFPDGLRVDLTALSLAACYSDGARLVMTPDLDNDQ